MQQTVPRCLGLMLKNVTGPNTAGVSPQSRKIAPAELEALLFSHPSIDAAAVVSQDDPATGEAVVAFVVQSDGAELTEDEVKELFFFQTAVIMLARSTYPFSLS
ncbi:hypothetical protein C5167_048322 [Papaver somniferum]|uniref:4-coumarate--CoA ligase n=1 Tax=Papaver somniferum TaxID=3469 RepID=A0A4Y7KKJ4_PAPSO|nr:hypothetical protein C5167_048322 [Papaver somniferum]